jgi:hypothetical protein
MTNFMAAGLGGLWRPTRTKESNEYEARRVPTQAESDALVAVDDGLISPLNLHSTAMFSDRAG